MSGAAWHVGAPALAAAGAAAEGGAPDTLTDIAGCDHRDQQSLATDRSADKTESVLQVSSARSQTMLDAPQRLALLCRGFEVGSRARV